MELRQLFMEAGCESKDYSEGKILSSKLPNLICVLPVRPNEPLSSARTSIIAAPGRAPLTTGAVLPCCLLYWRACATRPIT